MRICSCTTRVQIEIGVLQHGAPGEKGRGEASVRAAFRLAAQYIALAQALQPGKDVYRKSLQACTQLCMPASWPCHHLQTRSAV